jgi:hypothetical protein
VTEAEINDIQTRDDFVKAVRRLESDFRDASVTWNNRDLSSFLEALAGWTEDMDGYFEAQRRRTPIDADWQLFTRMLAAASVYE